jgi:hypothetical protein
MYFPPIEESRPARCPSCRRWYIVDRIRMACCVMHSPGSCCHICEIEVPGPASENSDHENKRILLNETH